MFRKLRNCSAAYDNDFEAIDIVTNQGEVLEYAQEALIVLKSYSSIVAAYDEDNEVLFVFPRWDYSVTTQSHIRKFAEDIIGFTLYKDDIIGGGKYYLDVVQCWGFYRHGYNWFYKF